MSDDNCETEECGTSKFPWLGPAIFGLTLAAVTVFFVWFLRAWRHESLFFTVHRCVYSVLPGIFCPGFLYDEASGIDAGIWSL